MIVSYVMCYTDEMVSWLLLLIMILCARVPLLSVFVHIGAVILYDFNHPSEYECICLLVIIMAYCFFFVFLF